MGKEEGGRKRRMIVAQVGTQIASGRSGKEKTRRNHNNNKQAAAAAVARMVAYGNDSNNRLRQT